MSRVFRSRFAKANGAPARPGRANRRLNRVLSSAIYYNFDYGFVEETRAAEG